MRIAYCSRECQKEHWEKVHKDHCKFLAGKKKADHSEHNPATCSVCNVGSMALQATNPNYICIWQNLPVTIPTLLSPHPFPLSGLPGDRLETVIIVLQHLYLKIAATKHWVTARFPDEMEKLWRLLYDVRESIWNARKVSPHPEFSALQDLHEATKLFESIEAKTRNMSRSDDPFNL